MGRLKWVLVLAVILVFPSMSFAVPQLINYQGTLSDGSGNPVNGDVSIIFTIYNASAAGDVLWTETQTVTVTEGTFNVLLGSQNPILANTLDGNGRYLGVKIGADQEMTPRQQLVSVPYAMIAETLGNKTLSELVGLLDARYGNLGDSLTADFSSPLIVVVDNPVEFTSITNGVPISWDWDFGDSGTSILENPSHTYTSPGTYTVSLTAGDGVTSKTMTKVDYITVAQWTITTADESGPDLGSYSSIAIGTGGLPVVSYHDYVLGGLKVLHCGNASCSSGNTTNTVDSGGGLGTHTSIAKGADGLPIVSYYGSGLNVAHCGNASCTSGNTTTPVDASAGDEYTSIAIGADGLPVISYFDSFPNSDLKVLHCGIANCTSGNTITTVDSAGDTGRYSSIAIGADNLPVVSYYNSTSADLQLLHCGNASCTSGNIITTVDSVGDVGTYTSIAIGADNLPVISYFDFTNMNLKVAHCGNASCTSGNTITAVDSAGDTGWHTSIAIGTDAMPVVSYSDMTKHDLKVLHCGNASCTSGNTITTVDSNDEGWYTSIAIGADNLPIVSYYDTGSYRLKVAHCNDAFCMGQ